MPKLRIAPRWFSEQLWVVPDRKPAEAVDIDDLGLSDDLADRLEAWFDAFEAIYDAEAPERSAFPDADAERLWRREGDAIVAAIRDELAEDWEVELSL